MSAVPTCTYLWRRWDIGGSQNTATPWEKNEQTQNVSLQKSRLYFNNTIHVSHTVGFEITAIPQGVILLTPHKH